MTNQPKFKYALLIGDILTLSLGFWLALLIVGRKGTDFWFSDPGRAVAAIGTFGLALSVYLFMNLVHDLYKRQTFRSRYRHLTLLARSVIVTTAVLLPFVLILGWSYFSQFGRDFLAWSLPITLVSGFSVRLAILKIAFNRGFKDRSRRRLLIVGGDSAAERVVSAILREQRPDFDIVGLLDDYKPKGEPVFGEWANLGSLENLPDILNTLDPDEILIAIDNAPYSRLVRVVDACLATGRVVRIFSDRLSTLASRLGAEQYAEGIPVIMLSQVQPGSYSLALRRFVDVSVSSVVLLLLAPLLLAVLAGIKISSPGPVIFRQTRIGFGGKPFDFYKFRSMHVGTSESSHQEFVEEFIRGNADNASRENELKVFKIKDDPRIFRFGRFIRRTSLDEMPQLFNVLKGDMGLVGPRPCLPYEWEAYDEWHRDRLRVVPGCTGLWQVIGRSTVTFEDMVIMDLYYISNYSLLLDFRILYKTLPVIFLAKGGY